MPGIIFVAVLWIFGAVLGLVTLVFLLVASAGLAVRVAVGVAWTNLTTAIRPHTHGRS